MSAPVHGMCAVHHFLLSQPPQGPPRGCDPHSGAEVSKHDAEHGQVLEATKTCFRGRDGADAGRAVSSDFSPSKAQSPITSPPPPETLALQPTPREGINSNPPLGTKKEALKHCRGIPHLVQMDNFAWSRGWNNSNPYLMAAGWN